MLRGFETSANPVLVYIDDVLGLGTGPFAIDATLAETGDFGFLCNVGNDRYFIPWGRVRAIKQTQTPPPAAAAPITTPIPAGR